MPDILDINSLFAQGVLALGAALVAGNGWALYQARRGRVPEGASGEIRTARAWWLVAVGVVMAIWGLASLLTQ